MTKKERAERLACAPAQREIIRNARKTAQLARLLWPQDAEDDLHGKVEILHRRLARAGQVAAAEAVASCAHAAAWRKVKRTQHIHDEGDVTQAWWYRSAQDARLDAEDASCVARQTLRIARAAEEVGVSDTVLSLVNAAYWVAVDVEFRAEVSQNQIPCKGDNDAVLALALEVDEWTGHLRAAMDELVAWAEAHDYTLCRSPRLHNHPDNPA